MNNIKNHPAPPDSQPFPSRHERQRNQMAARALLGGVLVLLGFYTLHGFIPALAWGTVFAVALWPLYKRTEALTPPPLREIWLPLLFTSVVAIIFMVPVALVIVEATREIQDVITWVQGARVTGVAVPAWMDHFPVAKQSLIEWWKAHLLNPDDADDFIKYISGFISTNHGIKASQAVVHRSLLFLFSIITLFFLFKDGSHVTRQSLVISRRLFGKRGELIAEQMIASIHGTVSGLVLVGIGEGIFLGVAYAIAGAPHPALFGIITGVSAMIPFCSLITIPLVSLMLLVKGSVVSAIVILVTGFVVVFIADHFIRPFLIGGTTKLPFLWVLLGILGGVESWGLLGLFVGPAIMAALFMLWRIWTKEKPARQ